MGRSRFFIAGILAVLYLVSAGVAAAQESSPVPEAAWMVLVSPAEGALVIGRKPTIRGSFLTEVVPETVTVTIDGTDYSAVAVKTARGFEVTPPLPLPPGGHTVWVGAQDAQGQARSAGAAFSSKHTEAFDELGSGNHVSANYDYTVHEPSFLEETTPDWNLEANLTTSNVLRKGPWKLSLDGVARYKDQDLPIPEPERQGADIISYTFRGGYEKGAVRAETAVGDVVVDETPYTVTGLARKGAVVTGDAGFFAFDVFSVRGDAVYGTRGGLSLDGGTDRHVRGGSGTARFFSNKATLKAVYVDGGEATPSFNIATTGGGKKGEVLGFRLETDFFSGKMKTDVEVDFSEFNPDTSSGEPPLKDHAIRAGAGGEAGIFTYEALFEYVGRDYEVIGNQVLAKNREGGKVGGTASFGSQSLGVGVSRYNDNVRDDPLLPVNVFWEAYLQYALNRWASLPISVFYKYGQQESDDVEGSTFKTLDLTSHDVSGQVSWLKGWFSTDLSGGFSRIDDRTALQADSKAWNVRLAPRLTGSFGSLTPSGAYNETETNQVRTEIVTVGLDGRAQLFGSKVTAEAGATWVDTRASDQSQDNRAVNGSFRLAYNPGTFFSGHFSPSVAFRGTYDRRDDKIAPESDRDDWTLFLTLTAEIPVVL